MTDLVEFLRARLDEDEQVARATTGPWKYHHETGGVVLPTARYVPELAEIISTPREPSDARHMVRWDSARVLREVEAKRRMLDEHADDGGFCRRCAVEDRQENTLEEIRYDGPYMVTVHRPLPCPCPTLRFLALPYADHPDYREEWRP